MKAVSKTNKLAKEEKERDRNEKRKPFFSSGNPFYISKNSHRKSNKK